MNVETEKTNKVQQHKQLDKTIGAKLAVNKISITVRNLKRDTKSGLEMKTNREIKNLPQKAKYLWKVKK